jgi:hypothetical protein
MQPSNQGNAPLANEGYSVATGTSSSDPFITVFATRDPTAYDFNFPVKKRWINTALVKEWYLQSFSNVTGQTLANWVLLTIAGTFDSIEVDVAVAPGVNPVTPNAGIIDFGESFATHVPIATGTNPAGYQTATRALHEMGIELQLAGSNAGAATPNNFGIAQFDSNQFTVTAGFVQISSFSPFHYTQITANGTNPSPYTVTTTDEYISCDTTAATPGTITILLPNMPTTYREFTIKDRTGGASANNIFVTTVGGSVTIDGQTTYTIAGNYAAINLLFNGTSYEVY